MTLKISFTLLMCALLCTAGILAQEHHTEKKVYFRVGSSIFEPGYRDNRENLSLIISFLDSARNDSTIHITKVSFCGAASPEGGSRLNRRLAQGRLEALEHFVRSRVDLPDSIVRRENLHVPWEYLASLLDSSNMAHREEAARIIREVPEAVYRDGRLVDSRKKQLMDLNYGRTWHEMNHLLFENMRSACVVVITFKKEIPLKAEAETIPFENNSGMPADSTSVETETRTTTEPVAELVQPQWQRKVYVKTNAVGWGMGIANAAVEVDLTQHWSFTLPVYYSAWNYFTHTVKFRTLAVYPEIRYWFDESNERWFAGSHFGYAQYNFALDGDYRIQDHNGKSPAIGGGMSAGFRMPISKDSRLKVELSLGAGIYNLHYDKFRNSENGSLVTTEKKTFFGIDRANISFMYTFGQGKKGGAK